MSRKRERRKSPEGDVQSQDLQPMTIEIGGKDKDGQLTNYLLESTFLSDDDEESAGFDPEANLGLYNFGEGHIQTRRELDEESKKPRGQTSNSPEALGSTPVT
ncbi:hypothetical protein RUM43_000131 [Polyplax serrata]|uniref:Uncharacterized protein n=1 Tax=Polyplax serrata TaxID=468196 RepID=A0AAN8XMM6_POLSC